jgi:membrane protein DedA with SNARE-associated domain
MPKTLARHIFIGLSHLGGFGLLAMGFVDSSFFLFLPLGNDLLFIAMTARKHELMLYYAAMATIGSVLGCLSVDVPSRKGGEKGLEKTLPSHYLPTIKKNVEKRAGWTLAVASLMPPPFPFTAFVAGAAGLQYPRSRLLAVVATSRFARFFIEGILAIHFGRRLIRWARSPWVEYTIFALLIIAAIGTAVLIIEWWRRRKHETGEPARSAV